MWEGILLRKVCFLWWSWDSFPGFWGGIILVTRVGFRVDIRVWGRDMVGYVIIRIQRLARVHFCCPSLRDNYSMINACVAIKHH